MNVIGVSNFSENFLLYMFVCVVAQVPSVQTRKGKHCLCKGCLLNLTMCNLQTIQSGRKIKHLEAFKNNVFPFVVCMLQGHMARVPMFENGVSLLNSVPALIPLSTNGDIPMASTASMPSMAGGHMTTPANPLPYLSSHHHLGDLENHVPHLANPIPSPHPQNGQLEESSQQEMQREDKEELKNISSSSANDIVAAATLAVARRISDLSKRDLNLLRFSRAGLYDFPSQVPPMHTSSMMVDPKE